MSEHTPGPWHEANGTIYATIRHTGGAGEVASTSASFHTGDGEEIANARLIAAAPDLLAACEAAEGHLDRIVRDNARRRMPPEARDLVRAELDSLRAAIAKARGEGAAS